MIKFLMSKQTDFSASYIRIIIFLFAIFWYGVEQVLAYGT